MERLSLIDVASEDDLLTSSPCDGLIDQISPGLSENHVESKCFQSVIVGYQEGGSQVKMSKQIEQALKLSESPEQSQAKSGKYNLRKSLAWDSAFFTSEGVLNHEELAIVNSTFKKTEACSLPIILEDARKSSESTSTLDNDCWALENLEVDLFENVRASIQKTLGTGRKALKLAHPSRKNNRAKEGALPLGSSTKLEPSSHNKKKSPVASERHGVSNPHHEHTSTGASVVVNVGADGINSSKILSRPPRVLSRAATPQTMPTKAKPVPGNTQIRASSTKETSGNLVTQKSVMVSKKANGGPCSGTSKSSQSSKPTLNSVNNSTDIAHKSPLEKTRMRSTSRIINRSSSGSITNKASTRTSGAKIFGRNINNPAKSPSSAFKLSSAASPSSSFDSVASGSSSSTLSAIKTLVDRVEASSSSPSLEGADNDRVHSPGLKSYLSSEDIGDRSCRLYVTKNSQDKLVKFEPSRGNPPKSCSNYSSGAKCYKPSGLKMPTPKIGYFDARNSVICDVKTFSQTRQQPNFLKATTGVSKTVSVNKLKLSKVEHVAPATQNMAITTDLLQTQSTNLSRTPTTDSPSLKQLSKRVGLYDFTGTSEAQLELCSIDEDFYPVKDSPLGFDPTVDVVNKAECYPLPKPSTKDQDGDLHPKHVANIPMEGDAIVLIDRSSGLNKKHSEMISCPGGQETCNRNNYHCDSPIVNTEKENIHPVD